MYPSTYFGLFPPFPRSNKVFVAMSFDSKFTSRWENVIEPAIRAVGIGNVRLAPLRVDTCHISDSVITEILGGISSAKLVFADVTTLFVADKKPVRNANVMYELGLAHATRLPEEVLVFRSDNDHLLFDIANVRINTYDPEGNPTNSKAAVSNAILESIKSLDQKRCLAVVKAAGSLDEPTFMVLSKAAAEGKVHNYVKPTLAGVISSLSYNSAISRLLDIGALEMQFFHLTRENMASIDDSAYHFSDYTITPFGTAIIEYCQSKIIGSDPEVHDFLEKRNRSYDGSLQE